MKWQVKALTQQAFSHLPGGERLNHAAQRTLGGGLSDAYVQEVATTAREHVRICRDHGVALDQARAFEFGAGRYLLKLLLLSLYGCRNQIAVDLRPLASVELLNEAIKRLSECTSIVGPTSRELRPIGSLDEFRRHYGISYLAPFDAGATGLQDGSIDLVSSTDTLEHIPPEDIRKILAESHRILAKDGLAVHAVNYMDHFASFDKSISVYNFLQFSDQAWRKYNSFIHFQNRLRHREYVQLFAEAGFEVLEENCHMPDGADLAKLKALAVARCFSGFSLQELSVQGAWHVLRKRAAA